MVNIGPQTNVKVATLVNKLGSTLNELQALQAEINQAMCEQVIQASSAPALDLNFRQWLKQAVYQTGRTVTDFANETGLSRQLCNAHSQHYDPSMANFVLSCEVVAEWQGRSLEDVCLQALRTTRAYKQSVSRFPQADDIDR